ncbi:phage regulatory protein/antirepressor Ant [Acetobacter senegalensis]|uniref:phage antirepressor KilAC domain-containing protein n=1 Tax=Acetobacter senegalensis TaxID=446692 RepID=UPI001EDB916A|nr:phage antirepressor KilAC domain-containing protein [Acetobacter senegalensis]MCG4261383.1 phage regulatory protein/antirepressor Ant [Acetobacter senegalensis]
MSQNIITPEMHEGELRILDTDLAKRLGFDRPRNIRNIIKRYLPDLDKLGPRFTVERVVNGGNATEYYLNRKQAIFITAKSETAEATDITIEIIERFDAYERGEVKPAIAAPSNMVEALTLALEQQKQLLAAQTEIAELSPKAAALDAISEAEGDVGIRDAGRELGVGQTKVSTFLIQHKWACREGRKMRPAHYGLSQKYCRLVQRTYPDRHTGETCVGDDFRITRRGLARLAIVLCGVNSEPARRLNGIKEKVAPVPFAKASARAA